MATDTPMERQLFTLPKTCKVTLHKATPRGPKTLDFDQKHVENEEKLPNQPVKTHRQELPLCSLLDGQDHKNTSNINPIDESNDSTTMKFAGQRHWAGIGSDQKVGNIKETGIETWQVHNLVSHQ